MTRDKKILYAISLSLFGVLLLAWFLPLGNSRIVAAVLLVPAAAAVYFLIKKRKIHSIHKRTVCLLMGAIAVVWIMLLFFAGLLRFGIYPNNNPNLQNLLSAALPIAVGIIAIEIIRSVLLAQEEKAISVLAWFFCLFAEILVSTDFSSITTFNRLMDAVGLVVFPAITGNLFYHYISARYGAPSVMVYRLLLCLYTFFLPYTFTVPDAIQALGLLLLPLVAYLFIHVLFEKKRVTHRKTGALTYIGMGFAILVMISIVMIISCQFRFGMIVVATESMTGELNKGDAIVYERYDGEVIEEGQVVVFKENNARVVHRVVKKEQIDGETRYYTKGDKNAEWDRGYITESDFIGTVKFKISYIGYPTLWVRDAFSNIQ